MSSYTTALSGLQANSTALNVVGDNLANMNTQGFKSDNVLFEDAMNAVNDSLQVGSGVASTITSRDFTQGSLQTTNGPLDAAIQGNGFFVVQNAAGTTTSYTRDGSFSINSAGDLVSSTGDLVQGWSAVGGVLNASGPTSAISIPSLTSLPPTATANMTLTANLDASATKGTTFATPIQVVDSLGATHTLTVTFTETAANSWSYEVDIPGADVTGGTAGTPTSLEKGTLSFDSSGKLTSPASGSPIAVTSAAMTDGAAALKINWNLYDSNNNPLVTQFAQTSASSATTQDGIQPGTATSVSLQNGGNLVATYSNGQQVTIAQLAVASIANPDSLIAVSDNKYTLGADTLAPSVGIAGTGDRGNVVGGQIEASNVDMATEFTNLIVYQRGYEASSKVITTQNQMDQMLLAINP